MTYARALQEMVAKDRYEEKRARLLEAFGDTAGWPEWENLRQALKDIEIETWSPVIDLVLEQAATTIAPPEMPPCRCVVWDNSGWFLECGCNNNADIQEAAAWCARHNAAAEIRALGLDQP